MGAETSDLHNEYDASSFVHDILWGQFNIWTVQQYFYFYGSFDELLWLKKKSNVAWEDV